jgi:hypothetical protein
MKLKVTIVFVLTFWITGCFASDIIDVFLKDGISKPVYIYKSSRSKKVIAEIQDRDDTVKTCYHSVCILKKSRRRYYVSVYEIFNDNPEQKGIKGWIDKEDCAVDLHEVIVGDYDDYHYFAVRLFNKPTDREPAIVLRSDDCWLLDNIKSYTVAVTDATVVDCYEFPFNLWVRVLVELQTGETLNLWTVDYSTLYGSTEHAPASRLYEYDKRK